MSDTEAVAKINEAIARAANLAIVKQVAVQPDIRLINLDEITDADIEKWLLSKHSFTWAIYSTHDDVGRTKAIQWFKAQLDEFYTNLYST